MPKMHYSLKLANEVYVTVSGMKKLFDEKKVFIIGYGSLLFEHGWSRRDMKVVTKATNLIECCVNGYKRGTFGIKSGIHFYGAIQDKKEHFNAIITPISSFNDWASLMRTEYIAGIYKDYNYRVVDVTDSISGVKLPKQIVVHMVANDAENAIMFNRFSPAPCYYNYVWQGIKRERSKEFQKEFLNTGGVKYAKKYIKNISYI
jgi:hypothetical protein